MTSRQHQQQPGARLAAGLAGAVGLGDVLFSPVWRPPPVLRTVKKSR